MESTIFNSFFLVFTGAAILSTVALYTRQPLIVAYIALGAILGPYGIKAINQPETISEIGQIGIIFLLFLLGLDLKPGNLLHLLRKSVYVALASSLIFFTIGLGITYRSGFTFQESMIVGVAMMFSSTIIGIKLLPTTVLHHRHTGEWVVSLLLLQDLIAIVALIFLYGDDLRDFNPQAFAWFLLALPGLAMLAWILVKLVLTPLITRFDRFHEYVFLLALGWCLGFAATAHSLGLSHEIGAFIGGVALASTPIAPYIVAHLKPLRDFFLILFFFSLGAGFNTGLLGEVAGTAIALTAAFLCIKPIIFRYLLGTLGESREEGWEIGFRLGQISEFSLLIAYIATSQQLIGNVAAHVIQATAILSFLISSYLVVFRYPSPIAISDRLRRD